MHNSVKWIIKLLLTIAIIFGIAWKLDVHAILITLSSVAPYSVAAGFALALIQSGLSAGRLSIVVGLFGRRLYFGGSFRVTLESMFFSQTFVSFLGGDALRIWRIRRCGLPLEQATAAVALDRLIGIIANHCIVLATLPWLLNVVSDPTVKVGLLGLATVGVVGFFFVLFLGFLRGRYGLTRRLPERFKANKFARLIIETSTIGRHLLVWQPNIVGAAILSLLISAANCLIFFSILLGFHIEPVTAFGCALFIPAVMEIAMLPISIAGWGVREGVAILTFATLGVPAQIAFGTSFTFALILLVIGLLGGVFWLFDKREIGNLETLE